MDNQLFSNSVGEYDGFKVYTPLKYKIFFIYYWFKRFLWKKRNKKKFMEHAKNLKDNPSVRYKVILK